MHGADDAGELATSCRARTATRCIQFNEAGFHEIAAGLFLVGYDLSEAESDVAVVYAEWSSAANRMELLFGFRHRAARRAAATLC